MQEKNNRDKDEKKTREEEDSRREKGFKENRDTKIEEFGTAQKPLNSCQHLQICDFNRILKL